MKSFLRYLLNDRIYRNPRLWSNSQLRKILKGLTIKSVLNVSGAEDADKEGGRYRDYFHCSVKYEISHYGGYRGDSGDFHLDLNIEPLHLDKTYDFVLCHTVLEHVYDIFAASRNLYRLTDKYLAVVVPEVQQYHGVNDFDDYWRFTPSGISELLKRGGFTKVNVFGSPQWIGSRYLFAFAEKSDSTDVGKSGDVQPAKYIYNYLPIQYIEKFIVSSKRK